MNFEDLRDEYSRLWLEARVSARFDAAATATAKKILASKPRYQAIELQTGVPWYVVGVIHAMESGCRFSTHLHNGDPLTAKTRKVPKARPLKGKAPFTWEESACDALLMKGMQHIMDWSVERICYELERYNGFGYRQYHPEVLSAYLWSGTQHYVRGKYVDDGTWDGSHVSGQTGAIALIKRIDELDNTIDLSPVVEPELNTAVDNDIAPAAYAKAEEKPPMSNTKKGILGTLAGTGTIQAGRALLSAPPAEVSGAVSNVSAWQAIGSSVVSLSTTAWNNPVMIGVAAVLFFGAIFVIPKLRGA